MLVQSGSRGLIIIKLPTVLKKMVLKTAVSYHTPKQTMQAGKISLNMTTTYYIEKILH